MAATGAQRGGSTAKEQCVRADDVTQLADGALIVRDLAGRITSWSEGAQRLYGYTASEALGMPVTQLLGRGEGNIDARTAAALSAGEAVAPRQATHRHKDGRLMGVEIRACPVRDESGRLVGVATLHHTMEERANATALERVKRLYHVLSGINEAIVRHRDRDALFREACRVAVERGGLRMAWIGLIEPRTRAVQPVASSGFTDGYLEQLGIQLDDPIRGMGPVGRSIRAGRVVVIPDVPHDARMAPWQANAVARGYLSCASFPIRNAERIVGAMALYADELDYFTEDMTGMFEQFAADLSVGTQLIDSERERLAAEKERRHAAELLERVFASMHVHVAYMDREFNFIRVNRRYAEAGGKPAGDFVGKNHFALYPDKENEAIFRRVRDTGEPFTAEARPFVYADDPTRGTTYWDWTLQAVKGEDGKVDGLLLTLIDRTLRTRAEIAIQAREATFRRLPDLRIVVDESGAMRDANAAWRDVCGTEPATLEGRSALSLVLAADAELAAETIRRGLREPVRSVELRAAAHNGTIRTFLWSSEPAPDGRSLYAVGREVTALKQAEEVRVEWVKRESALRELSEQNAFKTQFLNMAAHELATPLTPIRFQLEALKAGMVGELSASQQEAVEVVARNFQRLGRLVDDLLDAARLQSGRLRLTKSRTDVAQVAADVCASFEELARSARVELTCTLEPALAADADPMRIAQVLSNLVDNALKFTPDGGRVKLDARRAADKLVISVTDTGVGLTGEQMGRIFRPFVQVHDPAQSRRGGTGLGLYISRTIVAEHGGTLSVASAGQGKGATFTATLPAAPAEGEPT